MSGLPQGLFIALKTSLALLAKRGAFYGKLPLAGTRAIAATGNQPGSQGSVPILKGRASSGPSAAFGGAAARAAHASVPTCPLARAPLSVGWFNAYRGTVGMARSILELGPIPTRGV